MIYLSQANRPGMEVSFDIGDRGLLLGDGVFDTSLVIAGRVVFKAAHRARFLKDAEAFDLRWPDDALRSVDNQIAASGASGALRLTLTRGPQARDAALNRDIEPTLLATLSPFDNAQQYQAAQLQTSPIRRNQTSPLSMHKTLAYTENMYASRQARLAGFTDALFLNTYGNVACTSIGNIFALYGRRLQTPPLSDGVLPGIVRAWILENAPKLGYDVDISTMSPDALSQADSVFRTNSLRLLCPVTKIDTQTYSGDIPEPLVTALSAAIATSDDAY